MMKSVREAGSFTNTTVSHGDSCNYFIAGVDRVTPPPPHTHTRTLSPGCEQDLVGQRTIELIVFDILRDHVSIHQPLPRVIASR